MLLSKLNISAKLYLLIFITAASLIGLGLYGIDDLKKMDENTKTLYTDRILCIQQLSNIRRVYGGDILPIPQSVERHQLSFIEAKKRVQQAQEIIDTNWQNYKRTYLTPEEKILVKKTDVLKTQADEATKNLLSILSKGNTLAINQLVLNENPSAPSPFAAKVTQLMDLQVQVAKEILNNNKVLYQVTSTNFILFILLSLVIALSLSFYIIKNIKDLIKDILKSNSIIKESEGKYLESESKFRAAFEYSAIGMALVSLKGNWLKVNIRLCEMLGYSERELLSMSIFDVTHPDDNSSNFDVINSVLTSEHGVTQIEKRYLCKDRSVIWASVNIAIIRDDNGVPLYFVTQTLDITERKKAEDVQKLAIENEERIRTLFDNVEGSTCLIDTNFRLIIFNSVFEKTSTILAGKEPHVGDEAYSFLPPDEKKQRYEILNRVLAGNKEVIEVEYERNGEHLYFRSTYLPVMVDGKAVSISIYSIDFTERKKAELLILKEKLLSETIINSLPGVFYLQSAKGEYLLWNKNFETVTGYTREEIVKLRTEDLIVKDDIERVVNTIKKLFTDGYATVEAAAKMKDGTRISFLLTGIPIMYQDQLCLLGTGIDISSRIKAEDELRSSEQKYRFLFESNPLPLWMIARDDLSFIAVNDATATLYGYTREEFLHLSVTKIRPQEDIEIQQKLLRTEITGPTDRGITRHVKKDGTIIFVNVIVNDIMFEGRLVRLGLTTDMTEKLAAEESLKKSEANLKTIMDTTDTAYALLDKDLNVIAFNQMAVKFVNNEFNHSPVKGDQLADYFPKERFPQFLSYTGRVLKGESIHYEINYPQPDGSVLWYDVRLFPITNNQNETFGLMIALSDITDSKVSAIQLEELNENLKKHAKELAISNAELEQFAYVASHDLQEPLRMVTSFMTQLEKKYGDVVDDKGKQYIHFAVDGAKRMRQIILDLLDFSRVGRTEDDLEEVNFNKLTDEILALYRRQTEELQARVIFENLPTFQTYKTPMRQVFQNLIGNSLKYHKANEAPVISITCKETKTHFQFSFKDNGIGISPEYFDRIFIIFQRLHNKDEYSGTGMGLAITKKIIENFGGKIWVESVEENGSTFYFTMLKNNKS